MLTEVRSKERDIGYSDEYFKTLANSLNSAFTIVEELKSFAGSAHSLLKDIKQEIDTAPPNNLAPRVSDIADSLAGARKQLLDGFAALQQNLSRCSNEVKPHIDKYITWARELMLDAEQQLRNAFCADEVDKVMDKLLDIAVDRRACLVPLRSLKDMAESVVLTNKFSTPENR
jgi:hypothetical protein